MGIVVTIFMLLGLLVEIPIFPFKHTISEKKQLAIHFIAYGVLLFGMWNFFWFGLQNSNDFWGQAALFSGFFMLLIGIIIVGSKATKGIFLQPQFYPLYNIVKSLRVFGLIGLSISFLLYFVTLVQLNLGLAILN